MPAVPPLRVLVLYALVVAVWGTTWVAMKAAAETAPPITASGLRFAVAFPLLALALTRRPGVPLRYPPGRRGLLALVTLGYFTAPFGLMNLGSAAVPSGLAAVLFATVSIFIVVLSIPVLGASLGRRQVAGVATALVALGALIADQTGFEGSADPLGALALLAAAGMHAAVYVLVKRDAGTLSPLTLNTLPMGLAALLLCAAGLVLERPDLGAISGSSLTALLYLGVVASVAGFLAYFELLRRLGPVPLALVFVLFPAVAQVVAAIGGERAMGSASLALLGVVLTASLAALTARPARRAPAGVRTTSLPKALPAVASPPTPS